MSTSPGTTLAAGTIASWPSRMTRAVRGPIAPRASVARPASISSRAPTTALAATTAPIITTSAIAPTASDNPAPAASTAITGDSTCASTAAMNGPRPLDCTGGSHRASASALLRPVVRVWKCWRTASTPSRPQRSGSGSVRRSVTDREGRPPWRRTYAASIAARPPISPGIPPRLNAGAVHEPQIAPPAFTATEHGHGVAYGRVAARARIGHCGHGGDAGRQQVGSCREVAAAPGGEADCEVAAVERDPRVGAVGEHGHDAALALKRADAARGRSHDEPCANAIGERSETRGVGLRRDFQPDIVALAGVDQVTDPPRQARAQCKASRDPAVPPPSQREHVVARLDSLSQPRRRVGHRLDAPPLAVDPAARRAAVEGAVDGGDAGRVREHGAPGRAGCRRDPGAEPDQVVGVLPRGERDHLPQLPPVGQGPRRVDHEHVGTANRAVGTGAYDGQPGPQHPRRGPTVGGLLACERRPWVDQQQGREGARRRAGQQQRRSRIANRGDRNDGHVALVRCARRRGLPRLRLEAPIACQLDGDRPAVDPRAGSDCGAWSQRGRQPICCCRRPEALDDDGRQRYAIAGGDRDDGSGMHRRHAPPAPRSGATRLGAPRPR